jgi:regulator of protease activity HflC (stomatin/prohibitin superfamily)
MPQASGCCWWIPYYWRKDTDWIFVKCASLIIFGVGGLILMIALLATSVNKKVAQDEYCISRSPFTEELSDVLPQGTYNTLGVDPQLMCVKRTYQSISVEDIQCLSYDKIQLDLIVATQYQYIENDIKPIMLMKFSNADNLDTFLTYLVISQVITTCGNFSAEQYYSNRSVIDQTIFNLVANRVSQSNLGVIIIFMQLKNIEFPNDFKNAITQKQLTEQQQVTELNRRQSLLISAQTDLIVAGRTANAMLTTANNTATINLFKASTDSEVIKQQWIQRGLAYGLIKTTLGLNDTGFINYLKSEILRTSKQVLVNFPSTI